MPGTQDVLFEEIEVEPVTLKMVLILAPWAVIWGVVGMLVGQ